MQTHELDAWLGDTRADLTDDQYARLRDEATDIARRYPDPDDAGDRDAALSATVQYLLGELTPIAAGAALTRARIAAREASVTAQQVSRLTVLDGTPEAQAARDAGIDRMTVRKVLGKR